MSWSDPVLVLATCPAYWCPDHVLYRKESPVRSNHDRPSSQHHLTAPFTPIRAHPGTPGTPIPAEVQRCRCRGAEEEVQMEGGGGGRRWAGDRPGRPCCRQLIGGCTGGRRDGGAASLQTGAAGRQGWKLASPLQYLKLPETNILCVFSTQFFGFSKVYLKVVFLLC